MPKTKEQRVMEAINSTGGKFFGITFTKKDGEERAMNARTHPNDNPPHWNPEEQGMKLVWDVQKGGFRTVTFDTVKRLTFANKTIMFD